MNAEQIVGQLEVFVMNIRLGRKWQTGTNALAYQKMITKKFLSWPMQEKVAKQNLSEFAKV